MTGIAIGDGHKFHSETHLGPKRGCARGANVAIVGMSAESDDAQGRGCAATMAAEVKSNKSMANFM